MRLTLIVGPPNLQPTGEFCKENKHEVTQNLNGRVQNMSFKVFIFRQPKCKNEKKIDYTPPQHIKMRLTGEFGLNGKTINTKERKKKREWTWLTY